MAFKEEQEVAEAEEVAVVSEAEEIAEVAAAEAEATASDGSEAAALESPDDIDLADRMKAGREQIITEVRKLIIGQEEVIEQMLLSLFVGATACSSVSQGWPRRC